MILGAMKVLVLKGFITDVDLEDFTDTVIILVC